MLKLKIKPTYELGEAEIQFYDLFVSQDLSFISGRASSHNSIFDGEDIKVVNNSNKFIKSFKAKAENVTVKGIVYYRVELPVKKIKRIYNVPEGLGSEIVEMENTYVEYNGDICFYCDKMGGYLIDHIFYPISKNEKTIKIDTHAYIDGDYVIVDDNAYYVDFSDKENPLKEFPYFITEVVLFDRNKWKRETKFKLMKDENIHFDVDDALYGGFENYVTYKGDRYNLSFLYEDDGTGELENIGYGVILDGNVYKEDDINLNFVDEYVFSLHKDIDISDSNIQLSEDEYLIIGSNMCSYSNDGKFMFLISKSEHLDIHDGNYISAESISPIKTTYYTSYDEGSHEYVLYNGDKYDVIKNAYDYVTISDVDYRLIYDDDEKTKAHAFVNGDTMYFTINSDAYKIKKEGKVTCKDGGTVYASAEWKNTDQAIPTNKIYYIDNEQEGIKYGKIDGYDINYNDGVKIGEEYYRVFDELDENGDILNRYIIVYDYLKYDLYVDGKNGSSTYICTPYIDYKEIKDEQEIDSEQRRICRSIIENLKEFTFTVRNDIFGERKGYPENFLYDSIQENKPITFFFILYLSMFKINSYLNAKLPFISNTGNNILKEDIVNSTLADEIKKKSYNSIIDMEKDVYYPVFFDEVNYNPVKEIRFNMHFRTRDLESWKVVEDYVEMNAETDVTNNSNWFICDYTYYKQCLMNGAMLHNVSDLVGYMYFTFPEVINMAQKISKSFLRLSFYSTNDPNTQVLLGTSTIFLDEALLAKKAFTYAKNSENKTYIRTQAYQKYVLTGDDKLYKINSCTEDGEIENSLLFNDESRLSSRITVKDKHNSDTSSEGFYFYMFREFSNSLRPRRIYLKIDFNHAGIGKTIPMIIPRGHFDDEHPDGLPLYIHRDDDLEILKKGFGFKDIYKQLYIPIDVIYDKKNNRYVYYLPEDLRENEELGVDDSIMEFNLFELKFKDESIKDEG